MFPQSSCTSIPHGRVKLDRANWPLFRQSMTDWANQQDHTPKDLNLLDKKFKQAITTAANVSLPLSRPTIHSHKDIFFLWWESLRIKTDSSSPEKSCTSTAHQKTHRLCSSLDSRKMFLLTTVLGWDVLGRSVIPIVLYRAAATEVRKEWLDIWE